LTKVWETPADFKIPECVLYDAKRGVLYVTSFNRLQAATANQGFISRLALDGTVLDLEWVTGLDGPCGMAIHGDVLYVAAGSGHLIEIDADSGEVRARHAAPGANFLNDAVAAADGTVYVTNSVQTPEDIDVFAFKDGQFEVWKTGDELCRCNGLLIAGDELLVGNTHGGLLKAVAFENRLPRDIVCLGAGVVDGIRHDGHGNYLVSRWEGQAYVVSPAGELVEILDTRGEGLNCADFEFIPEQRLLVVPTFLGNKVVAYRLSDE